MCIMRLDHSFDASTWPLHAVALDAQTLLLRLGLFSRPDTETFQKSRSKSSHEYVFLVVCLPYLCFAKVGPQTLSFPINTPPSSNVFVLLVVLRELKLSQHSRSSF